MMVKMASTTSMRISADKAQTQPEKLSPSGWPFGREVRDEPFQEKPVEHELDEWFVRLLSSHAEEADGDQQRDRAESTRERSSRAGR